MAMAQRMITIHVNCCEEVGSCCDLCSCCFLPVSVSLNLNIIILILRRVHVHGFDNYNNNNNKWTFGAPNLKRIALSAYKSNIYISLDVRSSNLHTANTCKRARKHTHTHAHKHTPLHTWAPQGTGIEEKVLEKRKVFKEDLKELTEDVRRQRGVCSMLLELGKRKSADHFT